MKLPHPVVRRTASKISLLCLLTALASHRLVRDGAILEAVTHPSRDGDNLLRDIATNKDSEILQRVRAIVC